MKRWLLVIGCLLMALRLAASPARPGGVVYTQPDGTILEIFLHGDEWGHWVTDREGRLLDLDAKGFYRLSTRSLHAVRRQVSSQGRILRRLAAAAAEGEQDGRALGTHKVLVLLIEFADKSFSITAPKTAFSNMLSQKGYDINGATGSVWDYFNDNSRGAYNPVFDVYGPVKLSKSMASYGKNNSETGRDNFPGPELALVDACNKLDVAVDFSQYDEDGDGVVDMILFYFAGYDEAEGGPADAIWSHQWDVQASSDQKARNTTLDGVRLGSYFCTSELQGNSGTVMGGIGSTVHEFSHHLGLPDFYDTDGAENGQTTGMYFYSAMSYGLYNNEGRTPPYLNSEELDMLGWTEGADVRELPEGETTLEGIQGRKAYRIPTSMDGEYYVLECRDGSGWDSPLPQGLLIYHVDRSERIVFEGYPASVLWSEWRSSNVINALGSHPCCHIVPASQPTSLYYQGGVEAIPFPGSSQVTAYQPVDWDGVPSSTMVSGIRYAGGTVSLVARSDTGKNVNGLVTDTSGEPLEGVLIRVEPAGIQGYTDDSGLYFLSLEDYKGESSLEVTASKEGYVSVTHQLELQESGNSLNFMLRKEGEAEVTSLDKQDQSAQLVSYSATGQSLMGAVRFTAEELAPYVGQRLTTVTFYPVVYSAEAITVLVEWAGQRLLHYNVPNPVYAGWNVVDISDFDIRIPEGEDVYIGYGVQGGDYDHPLSCRASTREPTESYYAVYNTAVVSWQAMKKFDLALSATVSQVPVPTSLADIGYTSIDPGTGVYVAGGKLNLRLKESSSKKVSSAEWFYDSQAVSEASVTLSAGIHTVEARLTYEDGRSEILEMEIEVK